MSTLFSHSTLPLPDYWTPEQAEAVFEFLNELSEAVWVRYELPLMERLRSDILRPETAQHDLFDVDDPLAF